MGFLHANPPGHELIISYIASLVFLVPNVIYEQNSINTLDNFIESKSADILIGSSTIYSIYIKS